MDWPLIAVLAGRLDLGREPVRPAVNDDVERLRTIAAALAGLRGRAAT